MGTAEETFLTKTQLEALAHLMEFKHNHPITVETIINSLRREKQSWLFDLHTTLNPVYAFSVKNGCKTCDQEHQRVPTLEPVPVVFDSAGFNEDELKNFCIIYREQRPVAIGLLDLVEAGLIEEARNSLRRAFNIFCTKRKESMATKLNDYESE